jgi:hypothetical protein
MGEGEASDPVAGRGSGDESISRARVGQGRAQPCTDAPGLRHDLEFPLLTGALWDCTSSHWERYQGVEAPVGEGQRRERVAATAS